jgi:hypothetical protein
MRSFVVVTLFAALGCGCARPALAQGAPRDTIVVNSRKNIELPESAVPWRVFGMPSYSVAPTGIAHIPHDKAVACDTSGDATVTVANRLSSRRVLVQCRPIKTFGMFPSIRIDITKGTVKLPPVANRGLDGNAVTLLAGTSLVRDTTVIQLKDGVIHPLKLGRTVILMDFAGMTTALGVEVYEPIAAGPLTLTGGEMKSWRLPRGRYEINLTPTTGEKTQPLALSMYRANCASGRQGPQHLHCVTYEEGALIVRNTHEPGPRSSRTGNVMLIRQGW